MSARQERVVDMTMARRVLLFGVAPVKPKDGADVVLVSSTGVELNACCGCIHEGSCIHLEPCEGKKMPCETIDP